MMAADIWFVPSTRIRARLPGATVMLHVLIVEDSLDDMELSVTRLRVTCTAVSLMFGSSIR